ncbi:Starch-binding associating with outer membrane [Bergeyella porcorum]|uniref:Starch-binding associating with outer membrane n=1 Tax=Bergeyella porcorum TaxID=1735111 RepID=A0AAU0EXW2_9FLAO
MKRIYRNIKWFAVAGMLFTTTSCLRDLEVQNTDDDARTEQTFFADPNSYKQFLAKIYGGLALTGQSAPTGGSDLDGLFDEGFSQYLRGYWQLQELTTDEALIAWNEGDDETIKDLNFNTWDANNKFSEAFFARVYYQISLVNEFLRETTEDKLNERGVSQGLKDQIKVFRAEARFLRAMSYYHIIDLFGNSIFFTEDMAIGKGIVPEVKTRAEVFQYIIDELEAIEKDILPAKSNEYGRVDRAALWMLQSKAYINAKVYTGQDKSQEAYDALMKVINSGYRVIDNRENLFLADNDVNGAQDEIIFPVRFDGVRTQTWGGMTFLIHASVFENEELAKSLGIDGKGWAGFRARREFIDLVGNDKRVSKVDDGSKLDINNYLTNKEGIKLTKFSNKTSKGGNGAHGTFPDTDFPMFRMADAYLMYAELAVVNGKGSVATALQYVNKLRSRAGEEELTSLNADVILAERAKELYWEGHRRQDLIRFGKYLSGYNWQWKGGVNTGVDLDEKRLLFAIPVNEMKSNSNLKQNPGY